MSGQAPNAAEVAAQLARLLETRGHDYAIGGAIALGYWAQPRGTVDVDLTLFLPPRDVERCLDVLTEIDCEFELPGARSMLVEHGYCRASWSGVKVDVFLPVAPFYAAARERRRQMQLGDQAIWIWDAESLTVFKMMFFRLKDLADVEQIVRTQGTAMDKDWVREQLTEIYGRRNPRLARWDEFAAISQPEM